MGASHRQTVAPVPHAPPPILVKSERTHFRAAAANSISLGVWWPRVEWSRQLLYSISVYSITPRLSASVSRASHSLFSEPKKRSRSEEHTSELQSRPHLVC